MVSMKIKSMFRQDKCYKVWNMQPLLCICLGLWMLLANIPTAAAVCESTHTIPELPGFSFGTLRHNTGDDINAPYVIINPKDVVNGTGNPANGSYVAQVTFDFIRPPLYGAFMWLFVMERNGTTAQFTPVARVQIPTWAIRKSDPGHGVQTFVFGCNELPIRDGQYLAYGTDSEGGSCYQTLAGGEYYLPTTAAQLPTLSTATYFFEAGTGYAMSFIVRNVGDTSVGPTVTTYGTLQHDLANDGDRNYVVIGEDNLVFGSCDAVNGRYVSRVIFDLYITPLDGAGIWLYAFQRNGTTNQFTVVTRYQIPAASIATGAGSDGIQVINLSNTDLPVVPGQYLGIGFNSVGGSCYRSSIAGQYYVSTDDAAFATITTDNYVFGVTGCAAVTFDVVAF